MRIISGTAKGRCLQTPSQKTARNSAKLIRPTADRAREALFSIIGREVNNAIVLDLYAGTGALGLEALSRAANRAVFIDRSEEAVQIIRKNIELCGFTDRARVFKHDLSKGLSFITNKLPDIAFSIVFVDPPYSKGISAVMLQKLSGADFLLSGALLVIEDDAAADLPQQVAELTLVDRRHYGKTGFWLYRQSSFTKKA